MLVGESSSWLAKPQAAEMQLTGGPRIFEVGRIRDI
jgi:hypothetical protein